MKYGMLTILCELEKVKRQRIVQCLCDCGKIKNINYYHLLKGNIKSCGCLYFRTNKKNSFKHGYFGTPEYLSWKSMKLRCLNERATGYKNYGGRGIKICEQWLNSFDKFLSDMGKRPEGTSLDRIDVNGNYEPTNCRWATSSEQQKNKRKK